MPIGRATIAPGDLVWDPQGTGLVMGVTLDGVPSRDMLTVVWTRDCRVWIREYQRVTIEGFISGSRGLRNQRKIARDL